MVAMPVYAKNTLPSSKHHHPDLSSLPHLFELPEANSKTDKSSERTAVGRIGSSKHLVPGVEEETTEL